MVAHPRAAGGLRRARPLDITLRLAQGRPLNHPRPLRVEADADGRPVAVYLSGCRHGVEAVLETWRIDDEWWRERAVSRIYFSVMAEGGRVMTVYRDLVRGRWARQVY